MAHTRVLQGVEPSKQVSCSTLPCCRSAPEVWCNQQQGLVRPMLEEVQFAQPFFCEDRICPVSRRQAPCSCTSRHAAQSCCQTVCACLAELVSDFCRLAHCHLNSTPASPRATLNLCALTGPLLHDPRMATAPLQPPGRSIHHRARCVGVMTIPLQIRESQSSGDRGHHRARAPAVFVVHASEMCRIPEGQHRIKHTEELLQKDLQLLPPPREGASCPTLEAWAPGRGGLQTFL